MSRGPIEIPRVPQAQPDPASTQKSQKRFRQPDEYDAQTINTELDYVHERVNKITVESAPLADLDAGESLANTIARVNQITEIIRQMGGLRRS